LYLFAYHVSFERKTITFFGARFTGDGKRGKRGGRENGRDILVSFNQVKNK